MPTTKKEVFFVASPRNQAFFTTSGSFPTFLTSPQSTAFFTTFDASPTFISSSRSTSFLSTFLSSPTFVTSSKSVAFLTTVFTGTPRDLKLKIGTLEVATDGTFVVVPDATGEYNPAEPNENPGGYNPELEPTQQYRPKRSQVWLWTVYRIRSRSEADGYGKNTQTPSSQAEQGDVPYEYTLTLPTEINEESGEALPITGLYELILIAAPRFTAVDTNGSYAANSTGTYNIINGTDTAFADTLTDGDFLYYIDSTNGDLYFVEQIDKVFDNTSLNLIDSPGNIPSAGTKLYGSSSPVSPLPSNSGGQVYSFTDNQGYYTLIGDNTTFTNFSIGDYIILSNGQEYFELGQIDVIQDDTTIDFASVNPIDVTEGMFILASPNPISLIDTEGTFLSYETGTYYNVEGDGTTFLTTALPEQYLFYYYAGYNLMGQIFKVYDDTNVWLYEAPVGSPTPNVSPLYTSSSPYTENANYADYIGNTNLYDIAAQYPGWYVTSVGIMLDDAVANCITDMRYRYLQAVMCGKCDDTYPELYAYYVGMLESMAVNEWERATEFYEKIKGMCTSEECSCSTC